MYRVYDNKKKCWVKNNVYLAPNDELFMIKRLFFGMIKTPRLLSPERYICHRDINLQDVNGLEVYEGDFLFARIDENKTVVGVVAYAHELSAYVILCVDSNEFFTLGSEVTELIQVVGNVFEGWGYKREVVRNGEQTLQETKV